MSYEQGSEGLTEKQMKQYEIIEQTTKEAIAFICGQEQGIVEERERIINLLEAKYMGRATNASTGVVEWSTFDGDVMALIKGEEQ